MEFDILSTFLKLILLSDVLIIQNTRVEGSGLLGELLEKDGFDITSIHAKQEKIPTDYFSLLVVLGAPESANDDLAYLVKEKNLIKNYVQKEIPVLGICLGSQLIANAFGSKVYRGSVTEIGFYDDLKISDSNSKLFSGIENPFSVFHWHSDTFDLPESATRLVSSTNYSNQAFQLGSAVGLQFHLEVDDSMVNLWLDNTEKKLESIANIDSKTIRDEISIFMPKVNSNLKAFYKNFKSEFQL